MNKLKRIIFLIVALLLLSSYGVGIYFALSDPENSGTIIVYCFALTTIISIFIGVLFRVKKYVDDKAEASKE